MLLCFFLSHGQKNNATLLTLLQLSLINHEKTFKCFVRELALRV